MLFLGDDTCRWGDLHRLRSGATSTLSYRFAGHIHPFLSPRGPHPPFLIASGATSTLSYRLAGHTHPFLSPRGPHPPFLIASPATSTLSYRLAGHIHPFSSPRGPHPEVNITSMNTRHISYTRMPKTPARVTHTGPASRAALSPGGSGPRGAKKGWMWPARR
jgi:hypothetical protein